MHNINNNMDEETRTRIKARVSQLETEQTAFYRNGNLIDKMANDRAIRELNKILNDEHGYE